MRLEKKKNTKNIKYTVSGKNEKNKSECGRSSHAGRGNQEENIWETLCKRIEELDGLEQIICDEESFGV